MSLILKRQVGGVASRAREWLVIWFRLCYDRKRHVLLRTEKKEEKHPWPGKRSTPGESGRGFPYGGEPINEWRARSAFRRGVACPARAQGRGVFCRVRLSEGWAKMAAPVLLRVSVPRWERVARYIVCLAGIILSLYACHLEHEKGRDLQYQALCDLSERVRCSSAISSRSSKRENTGGGWGGSRQELFGICSVG